MPLYEFKCPSCGVKFEQLCPSDIKTFCCPSCGAEGKRVFSTFRSTGRRSGGSPASSGGCGG